MAHARMVNLKDPYVVGHSRHVSRYAVLIAKELGLSADRIERVRKAALLHDVGKSNIPKAILFKASHLTHAEYMLMQTHTTLGADMLTHYESLQALAPLVRHHHERFDGQGYPQKLKGEDIPLEARIICLADAVEAMASDRPYQRGIHRERILMEIQVHAGTQFDPQVVQAFLQVVRREGLHLIVNSAQHVQPGDHQETLKSLMLQEAG